MAVTNPKSTGKYGGKKVNSTAIQWRMNMSTLGEVVWRFFRRTRSNRSAIVCCYDTQSCAWPFAFTTGKTGCINGPMTIPWRGQRQILCVFLALLRNCEQYNKVPQ